MSYCNGIKDNCFGLILLKGIFVCHQKFKCYFFRIFSSFFVAILDLLHDVEAIHNLCKLLTVFDFFSIYMIDAYATAKCIFGFHSYFTKDFEMLLAV